MLRKYFLRMFRKAVRALYMMQPHVRALLGTGVVLGILVVVLICAIAGRAKAERSLALPTSTPDASATPEAGITYQQSAAAYASADESATPEPSATPLIQFEKGDSGEEIIAIQERLMELGYLDIDEPTEHFGNATKSAVQRFQRQHSLQQDGIVGNETYQLLFSKDAKPYVMYEGSEGNDITSFQKMLYELGYLAHSQITGYYGSDTVSAVKQFQSRNGLHEDGKAGELTIEAINSADARASRSKEAEIAAERKAAEEAAKKKTTAYKISNFISIAKDQLGSPYILGDSGPDSFDCSGLVYYCLRKAGVYCRRLNARGYSNTSSWTEIDDLDDVEKGDLLFFKSDSDSSVGHVGIYIGNGMMVDASSAEGKVVKRSCRTAYWKRNFVNARRIFED